MELKHLLTNIKDRQSLLNPELKSLQSELEIIYEKNALESGVIDRGYFSSFNVILDRYQERRIISQFMVSEEEYVDNGKLVKIPVVDIFTGFDNRRLFILPKSVIRDLKIDNLFN
jgi:hypothetical protein